MTIFNKQLETEGRKLVAQATAPSTITGEGAFFIKIVSGIAEGFYVDDQGQEIQITNNGALNAAGGGAVDSVNGLTGAVVLTTTNIAEGTNEYYTEGKVSANASVAANTAKVSADGSVTTHSDVGGVAPTDGQVLTWVNANNRYEPQNASGGITTATIDIPTSGTLAGRLSSATGLPGGWSLVLGNDGSADSGFSGTADDVVLIHNQSKIATISLLWDFGTAHYQEVVWAAGDVRQSNDLNQLFMATFNTKTSSAAAKLLVTFF